MKVSVLTCVLGNPDELRDTFNSILPHLSENFGWLIKASDANEGYLAQFEHPFVTIINQRDSSLYDAMNQGLFALKSDYYFVLGAGDKLVTEGVVHLLNNMDSDASHYFYSLILRKSGGVFSPNPDRIQFNMTCPHPASVLKVKNSQVLKGFDTKYLIAADYDHLSKYVKEYGKGQIVNQPLVNFMGGGMSESRLIEGMIEEELIRKRVWKASDYQIYASMLSNGSKMAVNILGQLAARG